MFKIIHNFTLYFTLYFKFHLSYKFLNADENKPRKESTNIRNRIIKDNSNSKHIQLFVSLFLVKECSSTSTTWKEARLRSTQSWKKPRSECAFERVTIWISIDSRCTKKVWVCWTSPSPCLLSTEQSVLTFLNQGFFQDFQLLCFTTGYSLNFYLNFSDNKF